jgi:NAD(P)-dependent dehydrogenase (short-subunit alcohol dehydrogenase family)
VDLGLKNKVAAITGASEGIDVVVNNAGTSAAAPFDVAAWERDLQLKLFAQVRTARAAIPHMKRQGGGRILVNAVAVGKIKVIAFLASDAASYVSGTGVNVDGGLSGVL